MLKCKVEVMAKEIEQQEEVLEETKYKFILERRDLLAKNEKLKNDLKSQKKSFGRLHKNLEERGYDLMIQEDLMNNMEKMPLRREDQMNQRIKILQEKEDKHVLEERSIMSKKRKVCVVFQLRNVQIILAKVSYFNLFVMLPPWLHSKLNDHCLPIQSEFKQFHF